MADLGRMEARVMQVLDRLQATVVSLSYLRLDGYVFLSGVMEAEETQADRVKRLLRKIHGMRRALLPSPGRSAGPGASSVSRGV
jgi:hypothetical protein